MRKKKTFLQLYEKYLKQMKLKVPALAYIGASILVSLIIGVVLYFILPFLIRPLLTGILEPTANSICLIMPFIIAIVVLDMTIANPWLKGKARLEEIESNLADALKQMADVLKSGGTYELALREVSVGEFGALSREMNNVLRKLEEGENFENAMRSLAENVESRLVQRTVTIIIDSVKAGAGLAEVLEDIAEDVREAYRINAERKTKTLMQAMFMFATGAVVAPYIFGVVAALIALFLQTAVGFDVSMQQVVSSRFAGDMIILMLQVYIFIEIFASSAMIALMREGKFSKSLIYFPILLLIAFLVHFVSRIVATSMLLGGL